MCLPEQETFMITMIIGGQVDLPILPIGQVMEPLLHQLGQPSDLEDMVEEVPSILTHCS